MIRPDEIMSSPVITAAKTDSILSISKLMDKNNIGSVVVVEDSKVVGILTERDIIRKVTAQGLDTDKTTADDCMTKDVFCLGREASLMEVAALMKKHMMRRIVVTENNEPVGIITSRDIIGLFV